MPGRQRWLLRARCGESGGYGPRGCRRPSRAGPTEAARAFLVWKLAALTLSWPSGEAREVPDETALEPTGGLPDATERLVDGCPDGAQMPHLAASPCAGL